ncbi:MAG: hypothetical protein LC687_05215 [Actinobacteria bacterium]|nr:hypothetical protein [Actinomycetota bacterium]
MERARTPMYAQLDPSIDVHTMLKIINLRIQRESKWRVANRLVSLRPITVKNLEKALAILHGVDLIDQELKSLTG